MNFEPSNFSRPSYEENKEEPRKLIILSCEGRVTEPSYFEALIETFNEHISNIVEVDIVAKNDNHSNPKDVLRNLEHHVNEKYGFDIASDNLWIVLDRESVPERKKQIEAIQAICDSKNFKMAITHPVFEFWLLLHVIDITKYDKEELVLNKWVSTAKKRRFIDKELSNILDRGYSKKQGNFNTDIVSLKNVRRALAQETLFCNTYPEILDSLGSNIGNLISEIIDSKYLEGHD